MKEPSHKDDIPKINVCGIEYSSPAQVIEATRLAFNAARLRGPGTMFKFLDYPEYWRSTNLDPTDGNPIMERQPLPDKTPEELALIEKGIGRYYPGGGNYKPTPKFPPGGEMTKPFRPAEGYIGGVVREEGPETILAKDPQNQTRPVTIGEIKKALWPEDKKARSTGQLLLDIQAKQAKRERMGRARVQIFETTMTAAEKISEILREMNLENKKANQ